jgi:hypothetical protein
LKGLNKLHTKFNHFFVSLVGTALICSASGCSSSNSSDALQNEVITIISWIETARIVGAAWNSGLVPQAYADHTFQIAQQNIQSEAKAIQSLSIAEGAKADLLAKVHRLQVSLGQGVLAIQKNDRATLNITLDQLTTASTVLGASPTLKLPQLPKP